MAREVPQLTPAEHGELIQLFFGLVMGLWPNGDPKFEATLVRGATLLARGLESAGAE